MDRKKFSETPPIPRYFGNEGDEQLARGGWTFQADGYDEEKRRLIPLQIPEGLQAIEIESDTIDGVRFKNFVVYDPKKAETTVLKWDSPESKEAQRSLLRDGWEQVDTNVARAIFVRTRKAGSSN